MTDFEQELAWVRRQMPRVARELGRLPDVGKMRLACSMHLDIKMVPLVEGLLARGAAVFLTTCNATTVRNDVVAHLVAQGAQAQAWHNMDAAAFAAAVDQAIAWRPTHVAEMGAEISAEIHRRSAPVSVRASLEATGSGVTRLAAIGQPRYPIFNWDDLPIKEGLHNRHMVGLTACHTFFQTTHLTMHEKNVLVVGFGLVGQGVAASARAYGGMVTVADIDPVRAIEARYAGYEVLPLDEALASAEVVITATGAAQVIGPEQIAALRPGAFLMNVGHLADEIDTVTLMAYPHETVLPFVEEVALPQGVIYLLAGGSMFNLTAGWGDSLNAFDVTLAVMTAGIGHIARISAETPPGVYLLPREAWLASAEGLTAS